MAINTQTYVIHDNNLLAGEPVIRGTKTPVRAIVELWRDGIAPEEIPIHLPHLTLAQVFGALAYYAENQEEVNKYIALNRVPDDLIHPLIREEKAPA
jgi:uncharacterized protein (DUF433 family)